MTTVSKKSAIFEGAAGNQTREPPSRGLRSLREDGVHGLGTLGDHYPRTRPFRGTGGPDAAGDVAVSPGLPTVMAVDGYTGSEWDLHRAPHAAGRSPIGRVPTVAGVAAHAESAFVTVVTWPGWR